MVSDRVDSGEREIGFSYAENGTLRAVFWGSFLDFRSVFIEEDAFEIARLFYETVHSVNRADYSDEQVEAWAPNVPNPEEWHARLAGRRTLVAEEGGKLVGFAELEDNGQLDMLYLRKDVVGRGVGQRLYRAVEREARGQGLGRVFTEASITARPFFERQGFRVVREQTVQRRGILMTNFATEKPLPPPDREGNRASRKDRGGLHRDWHLALGGGGRLYAPRIRESPFPETELPASRIIGN